MPDRYEAQGWLDYMEQIGWDALHNRHIVVERGGDRIWPFNFLIRLEQPVVQGLSRHGDRTQLFTSRGTGFWGPPFRVFAPSEITLLTLRRA